MWKRIGNIQTARVFIYLIYFLWGNSYVTYVTIDEEPIYVV